MNCPQCGSEFAPDLLVCPSCHALVHGAELKQLALEAEQLTAAENLTEALIRWRRALELLPPNSSQHAAIARKVEDLVRRVDASAPAKAPKPKWVQTAGVLGGLALLLWKAKFLVVFFLTKAKLLIFGLTKASTFFSMILSLGVYWAMWGWKFALGLVLSIYVHEMGHVVMLRRYGIRATAPMFIPGLGALIRLKQYPANAHEDARVGLAGPIWGLGAACAAYALYLGTGAQIFAAIAKVGAWINLFNLLPIFQLDGAHAFRALSKAERFAIAALMLLFWMVTHEGLLLILGVVALARAFQKTAPTGKNRRILGEFAFLIAALSLLCSVALDLAPEQQQPLVQTTVPASR